MAIKNFLVKTKQITKGKKGLARQLRYIHNDKAPSHKETKIIPLLHGKKLTTAYDERRVERQRLGLRGGGVRNHASRFIISVPSTVAHPTPKQWKKILKECLAGVAKANSLDLAELGKHCEAVLHNEERSGKHSHIHLVISNVVNLEYCKGITQLRTSYAIKTALNKAVKDVLGVDHRHYLPKDTKQLKKAKKQRQRDLDKISKPSSPNPFRRRFKKKKDGSTSN